MGECQKEFATLIKATLQYLQEEWGEHVHLALKEPPVQQPKPAPSASSASRPKTLSEKKHEESKPSGNWVLNPMPLPPEQAPEFTGQFQSIPLEIPIRLVVADPSHVFFLESVARALTKLIAPAALYSGKLDSILTNRSVQLVLAPLSHIQKRFPQAQLHQFIQLEGPKLLPLADRYDLELKHALWNTLKHFQNTPPSSSM